MTCLLVWLENINWVIYYSVEEKEITDFCSFCIFALIVQQEKIPQKTCSSGQEWQAHQVKPFLVFSASSREYSLCFIVSRLLKKSLRAWWRHKSQDIDRLLVFLQLYGMLSLPLLRAEVTYHKCSLTLEQACQSRKTAELSSSIVSPHFLHFFRLLPGKICVGHNIARMSFHHFVASLRKGNSFCFIIRNYL